MKYQAILFDLDGTLLPMDQEEFVKAYFGLLAKKMAPYGYEPKQLIDVIWKGTSAMVRNDGSSLNEECFWKMFSSVYGKERLKDIEHFESFYKNEFQMAQSACGYQPLAKEVIHACKGKTQVVLATNPIFPQIATHSRVRWAGLRPDDFTYITTYENSHYSKPNIDYYREITNRLELDPDRCLMIGNDVGEDMVAAQLGMDTFLLTDCLINSANKDLSVYQKGTMDELLNFVQGL